VVEVLAGARVGAGAGHITQASAPAVTRRESRRPQHRQREQLAWIAKTNPALHRAWALKEGLRTVSAIARRSPTEAVEALDRWISWARRCRLPQFVKLAQRAVRNYDLIVASIEHRLSNALVESMNTKIRLIVRMAFGFHSAQAIIALAMLSLSGHRPTLPTDDHQIHPRMNQESLKNRLGRIQYRTDLLDGFLTHAGLTLEPDTT
jgi:transposase